MKELSENRFCSHAVSLIGIFLGMVSAKIKTLLVDLNVSNPKSAFLTPRDPFVSGCIGASLRTILPVRTTVASPKILSSIVQSIPISMVNFIMRIADKCSVHVNHLPSVGIFSFCVERSGCFGPRSAPIPLHQEIVIGNVYDGVLAFCKGDQLDRFVLWLDDGVSFHSGLHKELHFLVRRSAATSTL